MSSETAQVKICGLRDLGAVEAAVSSGASYIGLVFYEKSPRYVSLELARKLALAVPMGVAKVALMVNPTDAELDAITQTVPLDILQLHGSETPERVLEVRARYGLPVMKAIGVAGPDDVAALDAYGQVADMLLVDAKPPKDASRPGGNGHTFDWGLISGRRWPVPWMLAGGLTPENVGDAMAQTGARQVDLSSAVESAPGVKDPAKIAAFLTAVQAA